MEEKPNYSYISQLSGGDKDFEEQLLDVVRLELPQEIENYKKHLQTKIFDRAADDVHKIKHKISILGLEKSYQVAIDHEDRLREEVLDEELYLKFEEILEAMMTFIKKA
ncbi:Hpt domain-containing protein [Zunongwangia endophytica]|uniref:Hpt domain-containing protein n=1 Tax=Zunongwangia endophytica TaxID=1808945 RepID=A0ABV8HDV5_9FLAO|nr:Hpt domain-containing protein [Zunongwangia endophytica]MDN3596623.1 Hpt domain-containing protein [Zunongwangia endophytica]